MLKTKLLNMSTHQEIFQNIEIENSIVKTDKISKKELVIDIYKSIFGITDDASIDLMTLDNSIEFLISNNKVQKVGMRKLIVKGVGNWFYKKFL